ncbi:MAG: hypothetical protein ACM31C_23045 [Acidobacteriota bacterium]
MAIVLKQNGGTGGPGGGSNPLTLLVISDDPHDLGNGQVRDGATISLAGIWSDATILSPHWTVKDPSGHAFAPSSLTCNPTWGAKSCAQFTATLLGTYNVTLQASRSGHVVHNSGSFDVIAISTLQSVSGRLVMLRAHEQGSKYGPPSDQLDVEIVFKLDSKPELAFGFQLRDDAGGPAHRAMYDLLRDAYANDWAVTVDYSIVDLKHNGVATRVWVQK